jgi:integrase
VSVHVRTVPAMSVHERTTGGYETRWSEGGRQRSKTFRKRRDAERFDAKVKEAKALGQVGLLVAGRETLEQYGNPWIARHQRTLAASTRLAYVHTWNAHIVPFIGHLKLTELTPAVVRDFDHALADRQGPPRRRRHAPEGPRDPVRLPARRRPRRQDRREPRPRRPQAPVTTPDRADARRPRTGRADAQRPPQRRTGRTTRSSSAPSPTPACSPEEALALRWEDIGEQTINVHRAVVLGQREAHQDPAGPARRPAPRPPRRPPRRPRPHRREAPRPPLVLQARPLGRPPLPQLALAGSTSPSPNRPDLADTRPYTLRHSFASLLIASGRTLVEVAAQLGHGTDVCSRTYARAFAEYRGRSIDIDAELATHRSHPLGDYFERSTTGTVARFFRRSATSILW